MRDKKAYWKRCFWTGHAWYRNLTHNMWECGDCYLVTWRNPAALGDPRSIATRSRTRGLAAAWHFRGMQEQVEFDAQVAAIRRLRENRRTATGEGGKHV